MAGIPKVRNTAATRVLKELTEAGIASEPLLAEAGLHRRLLNRKGGWVPYENYARLLDVAAREFDDPYYGIDLAGRIDPHDYGALAYIGLASETLEDALLNLERYLSVQTEAWTINLLMESRTAIVQSRRPTVTDFTRYIHASEAAVASLVFAYQFFLGQPLAPLEVQFVHPLARGRKKQDIEKRLGCPVSFSNNQEQVILDRKSLQLPIVTADNHLLEILKDYCEQVLSQQPQTKSSLIAEIRQAIADRLSKGRVTADLIATALGMTRRTMHRRLAEQDASFTDLLDDMRRDLAQKYIADPKLTFQEIAFLLGYADQSAFSVAFKRWTGQAPRDARRQSV
jgi:AraC-like DNA-binding protein